MVVFSVVGDAMSVHQSSVSRAIAGVIQAIYRKALSEVKMRSGLQERTTVVEKNFEESKFL